MNPRTSVSAVDPQNPTPLYAQLEEILRQRLSTEWGPGEQIPSEAQLCDQYQISRITLRHAIARLVNQGMLERGRGRGTFVRDTRLTAEVRSVSSFTDEITSLRMKPGSRVVGIEEVGADFEQSQILRVPEGEPLIRLVRIRTGDDVPIGIQRTHLVANLVPVLADMVSDNFSLYAVLREQFGVRPTEAVETYSVGLLEEKNAALLGAKAGVPVFLIGRVTRAGNEVFEHTSSVMLGDKYRIRLGLRN